jgi:hypothetical protein
LHILSSYWHPSYITAVADNCNIHSDSTMSKLEWCKNAAFFNTLVWREFQHGAPQLGFLSEKFSFHAGTIPQLTNKHVQK